MNRRDFLITASAAALAPQVSFARSQFELVAEPVEAQILPAEEYAATQSFGFNGGLPGPEIRTRQGHPLEVLLRNKLNEGTAVHWHGIRLPNAMDGVPVLTQKIVDPDATHTYQFSPPDAGTFWYHSHYLSHEQVARGLMGPLIIEEATPPDVDHDITAVLADWRLDQNGQLTDDFATMHDIAHGGRMGNFARAFLPDVPLKTGERIRLRLINAATDRIFPLNLSGIKGKIVALDGMPLTAARDFETIELAPAQRVDIIADVESTLEIAMATRGGSYPLGQIDPVGSTEPRTIPIPVLSPNEVPRPGDVAQELVLTMQGGAMGGRHGGDNIWAFNDLSDMQPAPFASFSRGETARLRLVNETSFPHGIHLHGHHFYEVQSDGTLGDLRDTSLVPAGETQDILCVFDNPGKWMLHCHMLSHQAGGMKTWVEVL
ncbi:Multicopper oxidase mco [Shimia thalassica]|uniref:Multicopper oxidase mco n=1 Tax=Shimia thalassica TaxID=1715693 RepID=A0A0P1ICD6_9RHOB|nr:multicopper oxidase family protein [Shimia thalassica]CUK04971.1 Multicopper oxidase mco [Shimia thalassica]